MMIYLNPVAGATHPTRSRVCCAVPRRRRDDPRIDVTARMTNANKKIKAISNANAIRRRARSTANKLAAAATSSTRSAVAPFWRLGGLLCTLLNCEPCRGMNVRAWWVLDPRVNHAVGYWDLVTTAALIFTAIVTPMEVGFMEPVAPEERWSNGLFLANRMVDIVFVSPQRALEPSWSTVHACPASFTSLPDSKARFESSRSFPT